mgnify:FL=1
MNYILSIIKPERLDDLTELLHQLALPLSVTLHGRGTAVKSMLELLGIDSTERRIVVSLANEEKTAALIAAEKQHLHIGVPGHGLVVAVPVKSVGGGNTVAFLEEDGKRPSVRYDYELIVAICSEGHTDTVMNAARASGARGGTVLHGKGTGSRDAQKFYRISLAEEKELVLIVSTAAQKAEIMRSILQKAGPGTQAGAIVFSLPISEVAGFGLLTQ